MVVDDLGRLLAGPRLLPADLHIGAALVLALLLRADARWQGPTDIEAALEEIPTLLPGGDPAEYSELLLQVRDAIAMGLSTVPIILVLVVAAIMQNWRRKLRGASDSRPTGGYR